MRSTWVFIGSAALMAAAAVYGCGGSDTTGSSSSGTGGGAVSTADTSVQSSTTSSSGSGGSGGGGGIACDDPSKCPGTDSICAQRTCENKLCGIKYLLVNMPVPSQIYGDCKTVKCDDKGNITTENDDTDVFDDGNACTTDACNAGTPSNTAAMSGTMCGDMGNPKVCDMNASCVQCAADKDCMANMATPSCSGGKCVAATCVNGMKDGTETDSDCGGSCAPCADTKGCKVPSDCLSAVCKGAVGAKTCAAPACDDNVKNGDETDIDCGGSCVAMGGVCDTGQACKKSKDCLSNVCKAGVCVAPSCTDGVQNGDEKGTDCGGSCPNACP